MSSCSSVFSQIMTTGSSQPPIELNKNLSRFHKINDESFLTGVQVLRCLTFIGFVGFAFASLLVPTVACGIGLAATCAWANKLKVKNPQGLKDSDKTVNDLAKVVLTRSPSQSSDISKASAEIEQGARERTPVIEGEAEVERGLTSHPEKVDFDEIKADFLKKIPVPEGESLQEATVRLYTLLMVAYSHLEQREGIPKNLKKNNALGLPFSLKEYLKDKKIKLCEDKEVKEKIESNLKKIAVNHDQDNIPQVSHSLAFTSASNVMEIIAEIYKELAIEKGKQGLPQPKKHFEGNAENARYYATQLRDHERIANMHFADDEKQTA